MSDEQMDCGHSERFRMIKPPHIGCWVCESHRQQERATESERKLNQLADALILLQRSTPMSCYPGCPEEIDMITSGVVLAREIIAAKETG